ncbi:MAG TPA: BsuPI-related putative proteinase inhibitor [Povalibacter sp.]|nr:BsuPI-related putative proteinase inhibitor [Povalibacter sp.]
MFALRVPRVITVLGVLAICLGASTDSCSLSNGGGSGDNPSFVTELQLQDIDGQITDSFAQGEPITLVLRVRNRLDSSATIQFPTGRQSDFVVVRQDTNDVIWKWSTGRTFSQTQSELDFAAKQSLTFTFDWDQTDANGNPVPRGDYEARGVLVYSDFDTNPLKSNSQGSTLVRFTVR